MENLFFKENMNHYAYRYADKLDYDFHVNEFDFPMPHRHADYWEFTLLTNGKINNVLNGKKTLVTANTVFYSTTKDEHYIKKAGNDSVRYINISVRETKILQILGVLSEGLAQRMIDDNHYFSLSEDSVNKIETIIYKINLLASNQCETKNELLCAALLCILQTYIFTRITPYAKTESADNDKWMQTLSALTEKMEFPTYSVNDLCSKLGYSRMQLNRLFNLKFNKSPHQYLIDYKLRYARNLLRSTDMKIIDIALSAGYSSASQFQTNFKNKYGLTPNNFRKHSKRS